MRRVLTVVSLIASLSAVGVTLSPTPASALPAGFTDATIPNPPGNPLSSPTAIVALPGARALVLEKGGGVRVLLPNGALSPTDALNLSVCTGSEMGLLGAAVDPSFILNGYVYLYYTRDGGNCSSGTGRFNRVSRFTMSENTIDPASELVLIDNVAATGGNHDGGDLEVGNDGFLYVSIGDAGTNPRGQPGSAAQDLSLLNGKLLRILTTGGVPADNPFVGDPNAASCAGAGISAPTSVKCVEIFAYGLRNPFRFAFDPNTGATRFFINDVGENTWEEVDEGIKGANYGWRLREGTCNVGSTTNCPPTLFGLTDPLTEYAHSSGCTFITAAAFVPNGIWPPEFDNSYLFGDGGCNKIWQRTGAGTVDYNNPFHQASGVLTDMAFVVQGPDPALYYVTNGSSQLHKITYDAPPAAEAGSLAYTPLANAVRVYDTRDNTGVPAGRIRAGGTRMVSLGINNSSVKAALVNLTMVQPNGQGFITATEARTEHPSTSNINAGDQEFVANASIVPVDASGNITVFSSVTTDLVIDLMGTFAEVAPTSTGSRFTSLAPSRLIDTREPAGPTNEFARNDSGALSDITAPLSGFAAIPANATSVALIVTGVSLPNSGAGHLTVYPTGTSLPLTSNANVNGQADVRPNLVLVPPGPSRSVSVHLSNTHDVVIDVAGYFAPGNTAAGLYHVIAPSRQVDTRIPQGFGTLPIGGSGALNPGGAVPDTAVAISQNVTMTQTLGPGFVTAYPSDTTQPLASNANASGPNQDRSSLTLTKVGGGGAGTITYFSSGGTDLAVDITGYFG
jgi:glucose/arabinose dehydrogenase